MQHNFILTDIMKTGNHVHLEKFISMHSLANQKIDTTESNTFEYNEKDEALFEKLMSKK